MANYFISVLVPMLYQSGYGYQLLRSMWSARLLEQAQSTGAEFKYIDTIQYNIILHT